MRNFQKEKILRKNFTKKKFYNLLKSLFFDYSKCECNLNANRDISKR